MLKIKNGLIHDAIHPEAFTADILVEEGKIKAIGDFAEVECETIDACGMHIYPGFIDAHSHIGMEESGIGFEGNDVNEFNDILCPQLRAIDAIQPIDPAFDEALRAGVTTVCTGPGSANVLGGQFVTMKTKGIRIGFVSVNEVSQGWAVEKYLEQGIASLQDQEVDLIIACCHWGVEREYFPENYQQSLGKKCIDWGADLVIGHHPHVLQGIEEYQGKYIVICGRL